MVINYVREREAFYDWLSFNTLSPTAQSLWNALFTIYNQKGWPEGFVKVPDMVIRSYMHVSHDALLDVGRSSRTKDSLISPKANDVPRQRRINSFFLPLARKFARKKRTK